MMKRISLSLLTITLMLTAYLSLWPVPVDPVAWDAPKDNGYVGDFAPNDKLSKIERLSLGAFTGPEDVAFGPDGALYIASHEGSILRMDTTKGEVTEFAKTGGRPLGVEFGNDGILYVADAYLGLLAISAEGVVKTLADTADGNSPINYADDVDIAPDGSIYFTDASTKFGAKASGGTLPGSYYDLMEHGSHGRVLRFDPSTGDTTTLMGGLSFANGLAMTASGSHFLVVETGAYSISKVALDGSTSKAILQNLPGFPDNINRNADGTFWVGIVSPRSEVADGFSGNPFMRKLIMRLPAFMRPAADRYGFVIKINEDGEVLETLQGPNGDYALTTGAIEGTNSKLYITSLTEPDLGVLNP